MAPSLLYLVPVIITCAVVSGCASDNSSDRQRPAYSFENVDMGPYPSGREYRVDEPPPRTDPYSGRSVR